MINPLTDFEKTLFDIFLKIRESCFGFFIKLRIRALPGNGLYSFTGICIEDRQGQLLSHANDHRITAQIIEAEVRQNRIPNGVGIGVPHSCVGFQPSDLIQMDHGCLGVIQEQTASGDHDVLSAGSGILPPRIPFPHLT